MVEEPVLASSGEAWEVVALVAWGAAEREVLEREVPAEREEVPAEQEEEAVEESLLVVAQE